MTHEESILSATTTESTNTCASAAPSKDELKNKQFYSAPMSSAQLISSVDPSTHEKDASMMEAPPMLVADDSDESDCTEDLNHNMTESVVSPSGSTFATELVAIVEPSSVTPALTSMQKRADPLPPQEFHRQRTQVMELIVKYITAQIHSKFPIDMSQRDKATHPNLPLDKFLMRLLADLKVTLPIFQIAVLYLFRYINLIYLLRYINQSNNLISQPNGPVSDLDSLRQLIIGSLKLAIYYYNKHYRPTKPIYHLDNVNWEAVAGISDHEIKNVAFKMIKTMNGKLHIKDAEVQKLNMELFKFVNTVNYQKPMVTKA
ncbi:hypothetical protein BABINDRAFT_158879 [Babjeviella inositovora NRRL Y-12698]|uniref:Uncharacterized protein n=1 Tax=Babjeviella inositovora NRRL Y-12698 TaxID=984486 RepID=A0A1E3QXH4_9ASCO|nr:uncharacterized protein BABINDRAFT_158879 [Babjeviella inositovora NRRL Y-12698]ODQ82244.1 hypothetical protein BABINDRAFT_158879 [Babjeviella inositovora NRRL Y-12698]